MITRRRRLGVLASVLGVAVVALAGCSVTGGIDDGGARVQAREQAEAALREAELIGNWRPPEERAARMQASADVLAFSGDEEHSEYTIRTTGEGRDGFGSQHRVTRCYGIEFDAWTGRLDRGGDCPDDAVALDVEVEAPPTLPPTAVEQLTADLTAAAASAAPRSPELRDAVAALVDGAEVATAADGAVGVAYSAGRDCVLGRITSAGAVEVWVPPSVLVAPGEQGCSGATAANGLAMHAPH